MQILFIMIFVLMRCLNSGVCNFSSSLHGQKIISSYAGRMSVHQFEARSLGEEAVFFNRHMLAFFPICCVNVPAYLGKPLADMPGLSNKSVNRSVPQTNSAVFNSMIPTPSLRPPLPG